MPIFTTVVFVCELCKKILSKTEEVLIYSDPVIAPPNEEEWDYNDNDVLCCPECLSKSK